MTIRNNKRIVQALVLAVCLNFTSCVKDGGISPRVLEGEWELVEVDGENIDPGLEVIWEFEEDGDFEQCSTYTYIGYDYEYTQCENGDWEWKESGVFAKKDEFEFEIDGDSFEVEIEVLDNETLIGEITNDDGNSYDFEFERVD